MARIEYTGDSLVEHGDSLVHRLVIPRPIAWVSTRSPAGVDNVAPHSFFNVVSTEPPILVIATIGRKDTARNAIATGELVVSVASEAQVEAINASATEYPPGIGEFDALGIARRPSLLVAPPSVADAPAAMECRLVRHEELGNGILLFGEIVAVTVEESVVGERGPDAALLRPVSRLGGIEWAGLGEISRRRRIPYAPGGSAAPLQ